jgi:2,3-bisphosphoglycerate-independent phosphoglycerate mutase
VPFILVSEDAKQHRLRQGGSLRDISPTVLAMLGLEQPAEMSGADLRVKL